MQTPAPPLAPPARPPRPAGRSASPTRKPAVPLHAHSAQRPESPPRLGGAACPDQQNSSASCCRLAPARGYATASAVANARKTPNRTPSPILMMMSDSTVEGCYDSQSHALRQKCRPPGQLTPRGFHRCSAYGTWPAPARSPHPKAKGSPTPGSCTPSPLAAPEGRIAVPEWDDAAAGALRGDPRASITKGEAEANDDLCSLCAANHDIPRSLPSSHPPQAARLARPPGHAGPDARAVGAVRTQTAFLGGRSVAPGRPLAHAAPLRAGCLSCGPPQTAPLRVRAPARPTRPCAQRPTTRPRSSLPHVDLGPWPVLSRARRPWPVPQLLAPTRPDDLGPSR